MLILSNDNDNDANLYCIFSLAKFHRILYHSDILKLRISCTFSTHIYIYRCIILIYF